MKDASNHTVLHVLIRINKKKLLKKGNLSKKQTFTIDMREIYLNKTLSEVYDNYLGEMAQLNVLGAIFKALVNHNLLVQR